MNRILQKILTILSLALPLLSWAADTATGPNPPISRSTVTQITTQTITRFFGVGATNAVTNIVGGIGISTHYSAPGTFTIDATGGGGGGGGIDTNDIISLGGGCAAVQNIVWSWYQPLGIYTNAVNNGALSFQPSTTGGWEFTVPSCGCSGSPSYTNATLFGQYLPSNCGPGPGPLVVPQGGGGGGGGGSFVAINGGTASGLTASNTTTFADGSGNNLTLSGDGSGNYTMDGPSSQLNFHFDLNGATVIRGNQLWATNGFFWGNAAAALQDAATFLDAGDAAGQDFVNVNKTGPSVNFNGIYTNVTAGTEQSYSVIYAALGYCELDSPYIDISGNIQQAQVVQNNNGSVTINAVASDGTTYLLAQSTGTTLNVPDLEVTQIKDTLGSYGTLGQIFRIGAGGPEWDTSSTTDTSTNTIFSSPVATTTGNGTQPGAANFVALNLSGMAHQFVLAYTNFSAGSVFVLANLTMSAGRDTERINDGKVADTLTSSGPVVVPLQPGEWCSFSNANGVGQHDLSGSCVKPY